MYDATDEAALLTLYNLPVRLLHGPNKSSKDPDDPGAVLVRLTQDVVARVSRCDWRVLRKWRWVATSPRGTLGWTMLASVTRATTHPQSFKPHGWPKRSQVSAQRMVGILAGEPVAHRGIVAYTIQPATSGVVDVRRCNLAPAGARVRLRFTLAEEPRECDRAYRNGRVAIIGEAEERDRVHAPDSAGAEADAREQQDAPDVSGAG